MSSNRRDLIRMTDEEMKLFIEEQKSLQVSCMGPDGWPHLTTLWFAVVDQRIVFETYTRSQKILNLQRNPNVTILLEDGIVYEKLRGVMIKGKAVLESKPENVEKYAKAVMIRNQPEIGEEILSEAAKQMSLKRTAVIIEPQEIISWDHTKLGGTY
ncbi:MAG: pyridoxamine 5'-phosphate oxidase family protein [Acidimicrobiales bacterium]|nr:pyridoxamine 5'-phosphate oxidase family protein [Acidimicrobiales bacterium]